MHIEYSTYPFSKESKGGGSTPHPPTWSLRHRKKRCPKRVKLIFLPVFCTYICFLLFWYKLMIFYLSVSSLVCQWLRFYGQYVLVISGKRAFFAQINGFLKYCQLLCGGQVPWGLPTFAYTKLFSKTAPKLYETVISALFLQNGYNVASFIHEYWNVK